MTPGRPDCPETLSTYFGRILLLEKSPPVKKNILDFLKVTQRVDGSTRVHLDLPSWPEKNIHHFIIWVQKGGFDFGFELDHLLLLQVQGLPTRDDLFEPKVIWVILSYLTLWDSTVISKSLRMRVICWQVCSETLEISKTLIFTKIGRGGCLSSCRKSRIGNWRCGKSARFCRLKESSDYRGMPKSTRHWNLDKCWNQPSGCRLFVGVHLIILLTTIRLSATSEIIAVFALSLFILVITQLSKRPTSTSFEITSFPFFSNTP